MDHGKAISTRAALAWIVGLYCLAHGLMLLNNGVFWDDWLAIRWSLEEATEEYRQYGLPLFGYYFWALNRLGIPAYHLLVFLSFLAAALCLHAVLGTVREIDRRTALVLVVFFALFPSNGARISIMTSRTALCYALFFAGLWLLAVHLDTRKLPSRIAALALFCASFLTHSLLVFYAVVPLYIAYRDPPDIRRPASLPGYTLRYLDFLLLPVLFWVLKLRFYAPYGGYRGYNQVTAESALAAFSFIDNALFGSFIDPVVDALSASAAVAAAAAGTALLVAALSRGAGPPRAGPLRPDLAFLLFGFAAFVAGVYPYLAVGKVPAAEDMDSRHQLLAPLGASFMLVYLIRLTPRERLRNALYALFTIAFLAADLRQWVAWQKDWYKEAALVESYKATPAIAGGTRFVFEDRTRDLNANGRRYRVYEHEGLFRAAFGDLSRHAREEAAATRSASETAIIVEHGSLSLTPRTLLELRALEDRDPQAFRTRVRDVVRLTVLAPQP